MAQLCPSLPPRPALTPGAFAELDLLTTLERGLSAAYTLFHSVDWAQADGGFERHGEIDIVAINTAGDALLIEVKAGEVSFIAGGIHKTYGGHAKDVLVQARMQYGAIRSRLAQAGLTVRLGHLLVMPEVRVLSGSVQWPPDRIVDSSDIAQVCSRVMAALPPGTANDQAFKRVMAFFENRFQVEPDVSALSGRLQATATRLAAGLATWVPRISAPGGVIRVLGTAGSGKTQLALKLLRDADAAGQRAAYLCFNRSLADHMAHLAPVRVPAETFHEFALRVVRRTGQSPDLSAAGAFQRLAADCIQALAVSPADLDLVVLDEVQDLQPDWVEALLGRLKREGRAVLLEDPEQQLYPDREPFEIEGAVTVRSQENFRSPRALVAMINRLGLVGDEVLALSPCAGELPDPIVHARPDLVDKATVQAVQRCLDRGFPLADIAIVSLKGRERSVLQGQDRLGAWSLKRFTGRFDEGGGAVWTDGELLIDSVRRFKGQAAPAVVLTECDLADLELLNRRLLFVGLTRARMHIEWVVSQVFADLLSRRLSA